MMKKSKIGILGGTFNPFHNGHIALGQAAYAQYELDKILVMVSKTPPHKAALQIPSASVRSHMVKLSIREYDYMKFSDFELQREGFIYTADTLTLLQTAYPDHEYYFIIGGDSLESFEKWHRPDIILKNAILLASGRNDLNNEKLDQKITDLKHKFAHADIRKILLTDIPYSSTMIREAVALGKDISHMVHPKVADYIENMWLYKQ